LANGPPIPDSDRANLGDLTITDAFGDGFQPLFILSTEDQLAPEETGCHRRIVPDKIAYELLKGFAVLFRERNDIH
jgi:hypothetical protein